MQPLKENAHITLYWNIQIWKVPYVRTFKFETIEPWFLRLQDFHQAWLEQSHSWFEQSHCETTREEWHKFPRKSTICWGEDIIWQSPLLLLEMVHKHKHIEKERHPLNANKLNSFLIYRAIPSQICCLHIKDIYLHPFLLAMYDLLHYCLHWKDQSHLCCS